MTKGAGLMHDAREKYFGWLVRHRFLVLAASLTVIATAAVAANRVPIDYTMEQFFPGWGPERERYDRYKLSFPKEDTQISLFWEDSRPAGVAVYRDLQRAAGFFEEVGLVDVTWLGNAEVVKVVEFGGIRAPAVRPLIEELQLSDAYVQGALSAHRDHELYRGFLWNNDQSVFAVHGTMAQEVMDDDRRRREVEETLSQKLNSLRGEGRTLVLTGLPVIRSRIPKLLDEDQRLFVGAGLLVFLAVLFLFFRHIGQAIICLASVVPAFLCTVALIGTFGKPVTVLTGFIPIIVLVVGGADIVHLLTHYRQARAGGSTNADAIVTSFSELAGPCFYTSLTTAIGFASLAGTRIGMVIDFGAFTAVGIFLTYAFSMTLLPVLLTLNRRRQFNDRGLEARWVRSVVRRAVAVAARPSRLVLAGFALVAVAGLGLAMTLRVDTYLIDDLKESTALHSDLHWIEEAGFSVFQVNLFLQQEGERPLHDPEALEWMAEFQEFVRDEPAVVSTIALPDLLGPLHRATRVDGMSPLPATVEEAAQLISYAESRDPEFFSDVYRRLEGEAQVIVTVRDAGSQVMLPFLERVGRYLKDNPAPVGSVYTTGTTKLILNYSAQVLENFGPSLLIAIVLIFCVMSYMFRSLRQGLLALVPNFFPLLVLLSVMKLAGFDLKPSTILVCSIAFGLAVDDTIHVLARFRTAIRNGDDLGEALQASVRATGPAIVMTSLVVSAGFSLLMLSRFEVLYLVGLMTVVSAISAVAADLYMFPTIIRAAWRRPAASTRTDRAEPEVPSQVGPIPLARRGSVETSRLGSHL